MISPKKKINYITFSISEMEGSLIELSAIKTNEDFRILQSFHGEVDLLNLEKSFKTMMNKFEKWVGNIFECKFITYDISELDTITRISKELNYKSITNNFIKFFSYQLWNIKSEISYKMDKPETYTVEDYLNIYGAIFIGNKNNALDKCFNTVSLCSFYKEDKLTNKEAFVRKDNIKHARR